MKKGYQTKKTILDEDTIFGKKADIVNKYLRQTKKVITRRRAFTLLTLKIIFEILQ